MSSPGDAACILAPQWMHHVRHQHRTRHNTPENTHTHTQMQHAYNSAACSIALTPQTRRPLPAPALSSQGPPLPASQRDL
eukprot:365607-Chlamydomonas_euryale.AAC.2